METAAPPIIIQAPIGYLELQLDHEGTCISRTVWHPEADSVTAQAGEVTLRITQVVQRLVQALYGYLRGDDRPLPTDALDFSELSEFERQVTEAVCNIPLGETRSYGEIAAQVGRPGGAQAVGQVMANNRFPVVVPCHRVVAADGTLGGYASGTDIKQWLLDLERRIVDREAPATPDMEFGLES